MKKQTRNARGERREARGEGDRLRLEVFRCQQRVSAYRARWVFPVVQEPIPGGYVAVRDGRVVDVSRTPPVPLSQVADLGDVALLPGFVNAHTHLELSDGARPAEDAQELGRFPRWIERVIAHRAGRSSEQAEAAWRQGYQECMLAGTCLVGDITQAQMPPIQFAAEQNKVEGDTTKTSAPTVIAFGELLGLDAERQDGLRTLALAHIECARQEHHAPGLSPHAPFTVRPELVEWVAKFSAAGRFPVAMHLAETPDELRLLAAHQGPLVDFLTDRGVWDPSAVPPGTTPGDYVRLLGRSHRGLVIHGNYLNQDDATKLARVRDRISVVCCPRTHAFFHHKPYPFELFDQAGVNVALGTDSRMSTPNLSIFEEMKFLAGNTTGVRPAEIVRMATLNGAISLGYAGRFGSLEPGKQASFACVSLAQDAADPYEDLFDPASRVL